VKNLEHLHPVCPCFPVVSCHILAAIAPPPSSTHPITTLYDNSMAAASASEMAAVHLDQQCVAGAVLVEIYTGLAYGGPAFVPKAKQELADCLARDGFKTVQEAVGADHR